MLTEIWIFLSQKDGIITKPSIQLISLAKTLSSTIEAVIFGKDDLCFDKIKNLGINTIHFLKNDELNRYSCSAYTDILSEFLTENNVNQIVWSYA